jgi:Chaperone of endosialidase
MKTAMIFFQSLSKSKSTMRQFNGSMLIAALFLPFFATAQSQIQDTDGNTKVQTEATPNEDKINFVINGSNKLTVSANAAGIPRMEVLNSQGNILMGFSTGVNTQFSALLNVSIGHFSGKNLTLGSRNTFLGSQSGQNTTEGSGNVALGSGSLASNQTGFGSIAIGQNALEKSTASENTGIGNFVLQDNTTGTTNTAIGARAGQFNTTGGSNTIVGHMALRNNTTGANNTAIGTGAGDLSAMNNNCTFLGKDANNTTTAALTNSTAIGNGSRINASNKIRLGNTAVTVIEGQVAYTTSDGRFKSKVENDVPGLDFVMGLNPVTYQFDYTKYSNFLNETSVDYDVLREKEQKREMGFIAQEVESLCKKQGVEVSNIVHTPENDIDNYSVAYGQLVVPIVKAMQEQQAYIAAQQREIEDLKSMVYQLLEAQQNQSDKPINAKVWPNPGADLVHISMEDAKAGSTCTLFTSAGKRVRSMTLENGAYDLNVKDLANGQYFVVFDIPGAPSIVKLFLKLSKSIH